MRSHPPRKLSLAESGRSASSSTIARNTISGDGVFQVGVDMKPGMYKIPGMTSCYYAVNADANGNNIKSNNITDGPATVTVSSGELDPGHDPMRRGGESICRPWAFAEVPLPGGRYIGPE